MMRRSFTMHGIILYIDHALAFGNEIIHLQIKQKNDATFV